MLSAEIGPQRRDERKVVRCPGGPACHDHVSGDRRQTGGIDIVDPHPPQPCVEGRSPTVPRDLNASVKRLRRRRETRLRDTVLKSPIKRAGRGLHPSR